MSQFYKYVVDLTNYQEREIPKEIIEYNENLKESLSNERRRFQRELHWDKMWKMSSINARLREGWKFYLLRPNKLIKGWVWISPNGELKNLYVSKKLRGQGWAKQLIFKVLNELQESGHNQMTYRCDTWNTPSKCAIEQVLELICCKTQCTVVEEDY